MLIRTRVSSTPDVGRIAEAVSRPGIDPRTWCSLAYVAATHFDPQHGYLADVVLLGGEGASQPLPARVATPYAGTGFGLFLPLEVDDEVIVVFPNGDPAAGLLVVGRLNDAGTPPPGEVAGREFDLLLLAKADATVRVAVQGSGDVVVDARGSGKVHLGSEGATRGAARIDDSISVNTADLVASMSAAGFHRDAPTAPTPVGGTITSASSKVVVE